MAKEPKNPGTCHMGTTQLGKVLLESHANYYTVVLLAGLNCVAGDIRWNRTPMLKDGRAVLFFFIAPQH